MVQSQALRDFEQALRNWFGGTHGRPRWRRSGASEGFRCTSCGYTDNADLNAAKNIAAGHAVTARGGLALVKPANREPQLRIDGVADAKDKSPGS